MMGAMSILLEIGPGRGDFLFWLAEQNPDKEVWAVEYKRKRFEKLIQRVEKRNLKNITLFCGDAKKVLPEKIASSSIEKLYILFSDPWPKRRHAHHRLFQQAFVEEIHRILSSSGEVFVAHDDPRYTEEIKTIFRKNAALFIYSEDASLPLMTFYAEKWLRAGRTLRFWSYRKISCMEDRDFLSLPCLFTGD